MIASLTGQVTLVGLDRLVLQVGGVGLLLHTTPALAATTAASDTVTLFTSLIVREDSLTLYGFAHPDDRDLFDQVQTVAGVGPRLALAMLSVMTSEQIRNALGSGDVLALTKVPGIGKKGAERLVLELRDKVGAVAGATPSPAAGPAWQEDVVTALVGLGWHERQAASALAAVTPSLGATPSVAQALRAALQELGR